MIEIDGFTKSEPPFSSSLGKRKRSSKSAESEGSQNSSQKSKDHLKTDSSLSINEVKAPKRTVPKMTFEQLTKAQYDLNDIFND